MCDISRRDFLTAGTAFLSLAAEARYTKLLQDRDYRLEWAEKIGMGFGLPATSVAPRAPLITFRKVG